MTNESIITVTLKDRGNAYPYQPVSVKKQMSKLKKYNKIKSLKDKELYPWQEKVVREVENTPKKTYREVTIKITYSEDATRYIAYESVEGKPSNMNLKKWQNLKAEDRINYNLKARYSDYLDVTYSISD